jgi:glucosamine--fructose-6-phosphate aminotransferase (isomerizing)
VSLVRREIGEQPAVVARLLEAESGAIAAAAEEIRARRPRYVVIAARGSSDNAARYAQHLFGRFCRLPVALATPSLHTLYHAPPRYDDALVIGISQSGASPDIVSVVAEAEGAVTVAVTNDAGSDLAGAARHVVRLHAGDEASVAATKTYTGSLAALAALVAAVAGDQAQRDELAAVPDALARQLERPVEAPPWRRLAVLGRGANYGTAFEAALKLKELGGALAEPYSPADFMHGPIAVIEPGYPVLGFAVAGPALAGDVEALDAVRARGGVPTIVTDADVAAPGEAVLPLEPVPEWLSPLVAVVPAQRLAVAAAEAAGVDADRPFGLEKVTRTR